MKKQLTLLTLISTLTLTLCLAIPAQVTFTDVAGPAGRRRLYRNEGNGGFVDVTETVGITDPSILGAIPIFADFDNDGHLDLFLANSRLGDGLLRNGGDGTFMLAEVRPIPSNANAAIAFDYDNDGLLDIFVSTRNLTSPPLLYHNEGNLRFTEIASQVGLGKPEYALGVALGDYDNDGYLDLFIANPGPVGTDQGMDRLYRNEGGIRFTNVASQAGLVQRALNNLVGFFWDYDNDGDLDLYVHAGHLSDDDGFSILY